jgi:hypothetical protein
MLQTDGSLLMLPQLLLKHGVVLQLLLLLLRMLPGTVKLLVCSPAAKCISSNNSKLLLLTTCYIKLIKLCCSQQLPHSKQHLLHAQALVPPSNQHKARTAHLMRWPALHSSQCGCRARTSEPAGTAHKVSNVKLAC